MKSFLHRHPNVPFLFCFVCLFLMSVQLGQSLNERHAIIVIVLRTLAVMVWFDWMMLWYNRTGDKKERENESRDRVMSTEYNAHKSPPETLWYYLDRWGKNYYLREVRHVNYQIKDDERWKPINDDGTCAGVSDGGRLWELLPTGGWNELNIREWKETHR